MKDQFLYETFIPATTIVIIALLFAEFIGRKKHIGRYYSFFMMLGLIPGIIGLIFSPSVKKEPTKANSIYTVLGVFLILAGIFGVFQDINNLTFIQIFVSISLIISAVYCFELSKGSIFNKEPKFYLNNAVERKVEQLKSNLDNSIANLTELKNKGILTDEEYKTKVDKIETEKEEQNLKNSIEYRQLKSLLDNEILTKEEFEGKIQLLQNVSDKDVDTLEISRILDSTNKTYLETIEEKVEEKNTNFTALYVIIAVCILSIGGIILYSNSEPSNLEDTYVPPAIDTTVVYNTNSYNSNYQEPLKIKKFVYITFTVNTPKLYSYKTGGYNDPSTNFPTPTEYHHYTEWEEKTFTTDILEIEDYSEDNKNRMLDQTESEMKVKLSSYDSNYSLQVWRNCNDEYKKEELLKEKSKIVKREAFDFDTYSEASLSKRDN